MISYLYSLLKSAASYAKNHPQILFVLMLLIVIPLLFLYTGQQFLDVGKANQERLQNDKVGMMQDTLSSLLLATQFNAEVVDVQLKKLAQLNPDIIDYKIAKKEQAGIVPFVALHQENIGIPELESDVYIHASIRTDESVVFESYYNNERIKEAYRAIQDPAGEIYFIYTATSLKATDDLFKNREQQAYFSLIFVYCFVIALAYWHIKLTDYRYLYINAQKVNQTKDLFTNMITHELRTPLTAICGYADILESSVEGEVQKEQSRRIKNASERLLSIVNDLLDVARLQSGKLDVHKEEVNFFPIVTNVVADLTVIAEKKGIELTAQALTPLQPLLIDKKRFEQALINVVSNALKYTETGSIAILIEEKHAYTEIRIKDTGMGISSEDQKKLFAPFFRVSSTDVSNITGTGLGMWITKELIELMGGTIGVESIKGVGTQIVITFPLPLKVS